MILPLCWVNRSIIVIIVLLHSFFVQLHLPLVLFVILIVGIVILRSVVRLTLNGRLY